MFCGCSAKARKAQRVCWHQELLVPGLVSRVIPNFLRPHKRSGEEGRFPAASLPLVSRIGNPPLGERSPFAINSASQSNRTEYILWAGRYLAAHVCVCNVHHCGVLQKPNGQAGSPNRPGVWRTASNHYRSPFRHLTHHLAAACR